MTVRPGEVSGFRARTAAALVEVAEARGSTPRESGAWMVVTPETTLGTIGGGQLEYMAIDAARAMLARGADAETLDIPLGPEIGQCCGGRTVLGCRRLDPSGWAGLAAMAEREYRALPAVLIFGAGHVGRALAAALALLPVRPVLIDQRAGELALAPPRVETVQTALPEAEVAGAAPGSAFVILTHDHALDFLIAREALARRDARYVGMIGSRTKRVTFERWLARTEDAPSPAELVSPIGAAGRPDKRPEVIAAFVAAEILAALMARTLVTA
ncbi:MAG: xanthine dehydrogenase accessory protein XdhC [Amaricoccus sp.]|uniref:xanthine dehydrogenase accessory protein XdhC n=1 Tax=Amaricoccus sp. TaxID=1872485 RepID=UPI0039E580E4